MSGESSQNVQQPISERRQKSGRTKLLSTSLLKAQKVYGVNFSGQSSRHSIFPALSVAAQRPCSSSTAKRRDTGKLASIYSPGLGTSEGCKHIYSGSTETTKTEQRKSVKRLSAYNPDRIPESKRMMSSEHKEIGGNALSFQWTAGGQICHGFIW